MPDDNLKSSDSIYDLSFMQSAVKSTPAVNPVDELKSAIEAEKAAIQKADEAIEEIVKPVDSTAELNVLQPAVEPVSVQATQATIQATVEESITVEEDIADFGDYIDDVDFSDEDDEKDVLEILDDSTKLYRNDINYPQGNLVKDYDITEDEKELFFGKSSYNTDQKTEIKSLADVINKFKKMGEYIDAYLPMSNVVVRIFEFENDLFLPVIIPSLSNELLISTEIYSDITYDRVLINKIFENAVVITKDSEVVVNFDLEKLSNADMNILILSAAKLLLLSDPDIHDKSNITIDTMCNTCVRAQKITVNIDDLLKAQYTKETIENLKNGFSVYDSFEENFNRSYHITSRKRGGVKYTKDGENEIRVVCKDPSYIEAVKKENAIIRHLLSVYEKEPSAKELVESKDYLTRNNKMKLHDLTNTILSSSSGSQLRDVIYTDLGIMHVLTYIEVIMAVNIKTNTVISRMNVVDTPMGELFATVKSLPKELKDKMISKIDSLHDNAVKSRIKYKFQCSNKQCNHVNEVELNSRALVFMVLQNRLNQVDETTLRDLL